MACRRFGLFRPGQSQRQNRQCSALVARTSVTASSQSAHVCISAPPSAPVGNPRLDELMLQDSASLIEVLRRAPWVRRVFFGHVHHECHLSRDNLHLAAVPALSFQFNEIAGTEKFSSLPAGLRLVHVQGEMIRMLVHRLA
jgi:hypothetical protein